MLYISRYIGQAKFGVVDTDDGTETIVTHKELADCVLDDGLDIKGVELKYETVRGKEKVYIKSVNVYQNVNELSRTQTKTKVLMGVDIRTYGDKITSITVSDATKERRTIRLSDYGKSCGEYLFKMMTHLYQGSLVIILDDSIEISGKSFKEFPEHGVCVDMREVTNKKTFEYIAREIAQATRVIPKIDDVVIDSSERRDYYIALSVLNRPSNYAPEITNVADIVRNNKLVNEWISKKFRAEFVSISKAKFQGIKQGRWATFSKEFARWLRSPLQLRLLKCDDYDALRQTMFVDVFKVLRECSTSNKAVALRFENYVKYFDATPEIREAFVRLCHGVGRWILMYGDEQGWFLKTKR